MKPFDHYNRSYIRPENRKYYPFDRSSPRRIKGGGGTETEEDYQTNKRKRSTRPGRPHYPDYSSRSIIRRRKSQPGYITRKLSTGKKARKKYGSKKLSVGKGFTFEYGSDDPIGDQAMKEDRKNIKSLFRSGKKGRRKVVHNPGPFEAGSSVSSRINKTDEQIDSILQFYK